MKVLHIFPQVPTPPTSGGNLRVFHILKHLCRYHDVTVTGFFENGDMEYFIKAFPEVHGKMHFVHRKTHSFRRLRQLAAYMSNHSYWYNWPKSKELTNTIQSLLDENPFDIMLAEFSSMGHFEFRTDATRILDAHNVEYDNFRRMSQVKWSKAREKFYRHEYEKSYQEEIDAFKRQDALFVTSERDKQLIAKDAPQVPQFVIPNGVDTAFFQKGSTPEEPYSIVFTGAMKYMPNTDGMIYFLDNIFPYIKKNIPQAKIYIVGSKPPPILKGYQSDSVIITGFVDDVRPYIDRASVFVVPLQMGSGTRLKVLEALSMRKPVVSTSIGCEGIEVRDDEHLLIRDQPQAFAEAVIELLGNRHKKERLIQSGYELVKNTYDWQVIGDSIEQSFAILKQPALAATV